MRDNAVMDLHSPIRLTHMDPARNCARYYMIVVMPTLFGDTLLVRRWGRIGTRGQGMQVCYPDAGSALAAAVVLARQKRRGGYVVCDHGPA
jgi:predicted DNA-binding WGR domain protein